MKEAEEEAVKSIGKLACMSTDIINGEMEIEMGTITEEVSLVMGGASRIMNNYSLAILFTKKVGKASGFTSCQSHERGRGRSC